MPTRPTKGDKLNITARDWSDVQLMLDQFRRAGKIPGTPPPQPPTILRGFWTGDDPIPMGSVVQTDYLAGRDQSNVKSEDQFWPRYAFKAPTGGGSLIDPGAAGEDDTLGALGITLSPAVKGGETSIAIAGAVYALIQKGENSIPRFYNHATVYPGNTILQFSDAGPFHVVDWNTGGAAPGVATRGAWVHIGPTRSTTFWVMAPEDGIPAATVDPTATSQQDRHGRAGSAFCHVLYRRRIRINNGIGGQDGLVRPVTPIKIRVYNNFYDPAGVDGDRRVMVSGHFHGAEVLGWSCTNQASTDIDDAYPFIPNGSES